jgi:hypothetical protein
MPLVIDATRSRTENTLMRCFGQFVNRCPPVLCILAFAIPCMGNGVCLPNDMIYEKSSSNSVAVAVSYERDVDLFPMFDFFIPKHILGPMLQAVKVARTPETVA